MKKSLKQHLNIWSVSSIFIALIMLSTLWQILKSLFTEPTPAWLLIQEHLLLEVIINTLHLVGWTALLSASLGVSLAWLISMTDFPFRNTFKWMLILPLAIPAYIAGYIYSDMLSFTGSIQGLMRNLLNIELSQGFYNIMHLPGAIFLFSLTLYPYVYMATKSYLEKQSFTMFEAARTLGHTQTSIFFKIGLPLLRPAMVASVMLVAMEVLNDYGLVAYFGIRVFSTAIFSAWFTSGDILAAGRLSAHLIVLIFFLILLEKFARGKKRYSVGSRPIKPIKRRTLSRGTSTLVILYMCSVLLLAIGIPIIQLFFWAIKTYTTTLNIELFLIAINALSIALIASFIIIALAILVANFTRIKKTLATEAIARLTTLGYSIPGAVIAIAVILLFTGIDTRLVKVYQWFNPDSITLVLTTSILMLLFAFVLRFMAIGYNTLESSYEKVGTHFTQASYTLGKGKITTFFQVDLPMIFPGILAAFIIVFIDILKELPLTLILRPFNYNTLATKVYQYASDEMIQEASVPALLIILLCTGAIYLITHMKFGGKKRVR